MTDPGAVGVLASMNWITDPPEREDITLTFEGVVAADPGLRGARRHSPAQLGRVTRAQAPAVHGGRFELGAKTRRRCRQRRWA